jgi:hypothetical protein
MRLAFSQMTDFDSATHAALDKGKLEPRQVVVRGKTQVISRSEESNAGMRNAEFGISRQRGVDNGPFWEIPPRIPSTFRIPYSQFTIPYSSAS